MTAIDGFQVPATASGAYPPRPGNRVAIHIDGPRISGRLAEAIAAARHSIWLTVAFFSDDFLFPDGSRLFDSLEAAVARGVDVRMLVWRANPEARHSRRVFGGTPEQFEWLSARGSKVRIRWDRADAAFCQHQKSWVIDAGAPTEIGLVGGMNLTSVALTLHDVYAEIAGPAATDLAHNFVERWNEATERYAADGNWNVDPSDELASASRPAPAAGESIVQVQRMLEPGRYPPHRVERSILDQYVAAIDAARQTIYLENQAIPMPAVAQPLLRAVERGVLVAMLVPAVPEDYVVEARGIPAEAARFEGIEALVRYPNFTLAGLTEMHDGRRRAAYVHAKMMVIDDAWLTLGSCNLHPYSLGGNTELNASVWDRRVACELRQRLFLQHVGEAARHLDGPAAIRLFAERARDNAARLGRGELDWQGRIFALSAGDYGTPRGVKRDLT